jgi:hypothetical protein
MKYIRPILIALLIKPLDLVAWLLVAIALPFAKWDSTPTLDSNQQGMTIRGDLPGWASFLSTPDERLPGGTYEPAVTEVLNKYGKWICSWYWLGLRNRMHGLASRYKVPLSAPWPSAPGYYEQGDLWWLRKQLGRFQLKAGWRQYTIGGKLYAVPACTITG